MTSRVDRLSFLTFNAGLLQFKCLGFSWYENPPFTARRLRQIPAALRACEADIVCMQEVFDVTHAEFIQSALSMVFPYHGRKSANRLMSIDNGLLILSKYPIIGSEFYAFEKITWSERVFGSKGILSCLIDVPSIGVINILNVHMVSGTVDPESRSLDDIRLQEMAQVLDLAQHSAGNGQVPIIVGDFNAGPTVCSSCYDHLLALGWQDAFVAGRLRQSGSSLTLPKFHRHSKRFHRMHSAPKSASSSRKNASTTTTGGSGALEITTNCSPKAASCDQSNLWGSKLSHTRDSMARLLEKMKMTGNALNIDGDDGLGWTWDPKNPLNVLGPHSGCHGLRCDHLFLPPLELSPVLRDFACSSSAIIFDQPRVLVYSRWFKNCLCAPFYRCFNGAFGKQAYVSNKAPLLVTLSDHHAVVVVLERCV